MGGAVGFNKRAERIAHLDSGEDQLIEDGDRVSEFPIEETNVVVAANTIVSEDRSIDVSEGDEQSFLYLSPLDEDWVEETSMTLSVFTTPTASVQGKNLNPLAQVSDETFVTAEGGKYLEQSGMLSRSGLGSDLSWLVSPAKVGSRSSGLFDKSSPLLSYLGIVEDGSGAVRTLLVHVAKATFEEEVTFGVGVQHRKLWTDGSDDEVSALVDRLETQSVEDLIGGDDALVHQAGIDASAARVTSALGGLDRSA